METDEMSRSRHVAVSIDRPAAEVYAYAADPANLPAWAAGLSSGIERVDGEWVTESPMGRVVVTFVEPNPYGVLDHDVTLPSGEVVYNPMRVVRDGDGCEVVFTVRRRPGMSAEEFDRDVAAVAADLAALRRIMAGR
ncbi:SRPBCC family protein [Micromonospora zhanjiangensis]|uniref:SRPBCC family protein n=1 Tax=Micromonospora zhanjiangensis TaxID=1522057 RepID=A0ABV8KUN8_9ACTN